MEKVIIINWRYLGENRPIGTNEEEYHQEFKLGDDHFLLCDYREGEEELLKKYISNIINETTECKFTKLLMLHEGNGIKKDCFENNGFENIYVFSGDKDGTNKYYYGNDGLIHEGAQSFSEGEQHIRRIAGENGILEYKSRIDEIWEYLTIDLEIRRLKKNLLEAITPIAIKLQEINDVEDLKIKKSLLKNVKISGEDRQEIENKLEEYLTIKEKKNSGQIDKSRQKINNILCAILATERNQSFIEDYCDSSGDYFLSNILKEL